MFSYVFCVILCHCDCNEKADDLVLYFIYVLFVILCHYANMIVFRKQRT